MRFLITEKLSANKYKTPEGYLVCVDSILARTGKQEYLRSELFGDSDEKADESVQVDRPEKEVFSDKTLASFENKAITIEHPSTNVDASNHNGLSVGFARDIKRGEYNGEPVMLGTLVFTNQDAIDLVDSGEYTELSCGYNCDILGDKDYYQANIRGNHIALCKEGRAGIARIVDAKMNDVLRVKDVSSGYVVLPEKYWNQYKLNAFVDVRTESLNEAKHFRDSLMRNDYMTFIILDVKTKAIIDGNIDDKSFTDFEYGYHDGKIGKYDKWYRYNRKDGGKEYDKGIQKAISEGYKITQYISDNISAKGIFNSFEELRKYYANMKIKIDGTIIYVKTEDDVKLEYQEKDGKFVFIRTIKDMVSDSYNQPEVITKGSRAYKNLEYVAKEIRASVNEVYFDHGQDWKWTTLVKGNAQILSPRVWQSIVNANSETELDDVIAIDLNRYVKDELLNNEFATTTKYTVEFVKDGVIHIHKVRATSLQDAIDQVKGK